MEFPYTLLHVEQEVSAAPRLSHNIFEDSPIHPDSSDGKVQHSGHPDSSDDKAQHSGQQQSLGDQHYQQQEQIRTLQRALLQAEAVAASEVVARENEAANAAEHARQASQALLAAAEAGTARKVAEEAAHAQMEGRRRAESKANAEQAKREAVELEMAAEQQRVMEEQQAEAPPVHAGAFTQIVEGFGDSEEEEDEEAAEEAKRQARRGEQMITYAKRLEVKLDSLYELPAHLARCSLFEKLQFARDHRAMPGPLFAVATQARYWRNTGGHALSGLPSDETMIRVMKEIDLALSTEQQKLTSQRAGRQDQSRGRQDSTARSAHTKREEAQQKGRSAAREQCAHQRGRDRGEGRRPLQALQASSTQADSSRRHDQNGSSRCSGQDGARRQREANGQDRQETRRDRSKDRHRDRSKDRHRDRSKDRHRDRSKDRDMQHRRLPTDNISIDRSRRRERGARGGAPDAKRSRDSTLGCDKKKRVGFEDKPAASRGWWPKQGDTPAVVQQSSLGSAGEGSMLAGSNSTGTELRRGDKGGKQPDDQCKPTPGDSTKWVACYSKSRQRPYWFDKSTGGSVWARPAGAPPAQTK